MLVLGLNIALWVALVVVFLVLCVMVLFHHSVDKRAALIFVGTGIAVLVVQALGIAYMAKGAL